MNKQSKIWGITSEILKNAFVEVHRLEIKKGGLSSEHIHQFKTNAFYVESGKIAVKQFQDNGLVDITTLSSGDFIEILPNIKHQFEGIDNSVVFEVYYPIEIGAVDIIRYTQGYIKP